MVPALWVCAPEARSGSLVGMHDSSTTRPIFGSQELTGRSRAHVVELDHPRCVLHPAVAHAFLRLRRAASRAGFDLVPASSFRDFDTQVRIWNEKWTGLRPLLNRDSRPLKASALTPAARVAAILLWSAPPGASRHHWGTELDVFDRTALKKGQSLQLVPAEYAVGGPFESLSGWLDKHMGRYGFYRPYVTDRGGVQPEPWHISHWPTAVDAQRRFRLATLRTAIKNSEVQGKSALLKALPRVYERYVRSIDKPPRELRTKRS